MIVAKYGIAASFSVISVVIAEGFFVFFGDDGATLAPGNVGLAMAMIILQGAILALIIMKKEIMEDTLDTVAAKKQVDGVIKKPVAKFLVIASTGINSTT
jgi:hypothetical protein